MKSDFKPDPLLSLGLNLETLRAANLARLREGAFQRGRTRHNELSHWSPLEWAGAMCGEAGEAANVAKKITRGDYDNDDAGFIAARDALAREVADTIIYADLLAARMGINLSNAVRETFNLKTREVRSAIYLSDPGTISGRALAEFRKGEDE